MMALLATVNVTVSTTTMLLNVVKTVRMTTMASTVTCNVLLIVDPMDTASTVLLETVSASVTKDLIPSLTVPSVWPVVSVPLASPVQSTATATETVMTHPLETVNAFVILASTPALIV